MNNIQTTHPTLDRLAAFDQGQLSPDEWTEIERHVAGCDTCCRRLEEVPEDGFIHLLRSSVCDVSRRLDTRDQLGGSTGLSGSKAEVPAELIGHPRYRVLEFLGAGGMGVVFKAEHLLMERQVALKVINRKLMERPGGVERFRKEVKAAARLSHPNIVTAHDAEAAGDVHFLVMEFVEGVSLERLLEVRGPLPVTHACYLVQQVALGLQHAFERGMAHRDIKPANLLLAANGQVKILDFGLARFVSESGPAEGLTATGTVVGTPDYMAPEQARSARDADIRADIYSLGCTLYHLLTGQVPFPGNSVLEKLLAHQDQVPVPLAIRRADLPPALEPVLERMLAKDPAQRYATPVEVAHALAQLVETRTLAELLTPTLRPSPACPSLQPTQVKPLTAVVVRRRPRRWVGAAVAVALLAGAGALAYLVLSPHKRDHGPLVEATRSQEQLTTSADAGSVPASPAVLATGLTPQEIRKRSVAWIRANNRWRPDHKIVADVSRHVDEALDKNEEFLLHLGPALMKSNKPTLLGSRGGFWYLFELTPEQARSWQTNENVLKHAVAPEKDRSPASPQVVLSGPRIDHALELDGSRNVTGSIGYRRRLPLDGKLGLRLMYYRGEERARLFHYFREALPAEEGRLSFSYGPMNSDKTQLVGPVVVFLELCAFAGPALPDNAVPISNPIVLVVNVAPVPMK
jgi:serine/threonine protein kinase